MFERAFAEAVKSASARWQVNEGDYQDPQDNNLWHCGKCKTRKQSLQTICGKSYVLPCICECEKKAIDDAERARRNAERIAEISKLNENCFRYPTYKEWTFANGLPCVERIIKSCQRYCDNFPEYRKSGTGLILCGKVGRGKSYIAAAICNELIRHNVPCKFTDFTTICDDLLNIYDKRSYYDELDKYQLLVLDDYGVERQSGYMDGIVETVINNRMMLGMPMIITTNKTEEQLRNPKDIVSERAVSRMIAKCKIYTIEGENLRWPK